MSNFCKCGQVKHVGYGVCSDCNDNVWSSEIDYIIRKIAKIAIENYGEVFIKEESVEMEIRVDSHNIKLIKNSVFERDIFKYILAPETKDVKYMINVEVQYKGSCFVGIYYKMIDDKWVEQNELKTLTTYRHYNKQEYIEKLRNGK